MARRMRTYRGSQNTSFVRIVLRDSRRTASRSKRSRGRGW